MQNGSLKILEWFLKYSETSEQRTPTGLKNLSVIQRCLLSGGNLAKIVTFGT